LDLIISFPDHTSMGWRQWSDDLLPDVLPEITVRLHVVADFVRFHAICKPWRDSCDLDDELVPALASHVQQEGELIFLLSMVFFVCSFRFS
jgi:hypothetical protein